eukprot:Colp12_sorted_trinity150504_noHs@7656
MLRTLVQTSLRSHGVLTQLPVRCAAVVAKQKTPVQKPLAKSGKAKDVKTTSVKAPVNKNVVQILPCVAKELCSIPEGMQVIRAYAAQSSFPETVEVSLKLKPEIKKNKTIHQTVQGQVVLPHKFRGGKSIMVFAKGADAEKAKAAGADIVGCEDLFDQVREGKLKVDTVLATPEAALLLKPLAKNLRANMPTEKKGTVVKDIAKAVEESKYAIKIKSDPQGYLRAGIGKTRFSDAQLSENLKALLQFIYNSKGKKDFLESITVSSTHGPSVVVNHGPFVSAVTSGARRASLI